MIQSFIHPCVYEICSAYTKQPSRSIQLMHGDIHVSTQSHRSIEDNIPLAAQCKGEPVQIWIQSRQQH